MLEAVDHVNGSRSGKNVLFCFPQLEMAKWKWLLLCASTSIAFNGRGWITLLHHVGRKKKRAEPFADADDAQMPPWRMPVAVVLGEKKLRGPRNSRMSGHIKYLVEEKGWAGVGWCFSRSRGRRFRYSSEAKSEWSNKWREREGVRGRLPVLRIREPPPPRMNRFVVKRFRWRRNVAADRIDPVIKSEGKNIFLLLFLTARNFSGLICIAAYVHRC